MAGNSDALATAATEYREARASVERPEGGVWPVGGAANPLAGTAAGNAEPGTVESGKIENESTDTVAEPAVEPETPAGASTTTGDAKPSRRTTTSGTKAGPAQT